MLFDILMVVFKGSMKEVVELCIFRLFFIVFIVIGSVVIEEVVDSVIVCGFFIVWMNFFVDVLLNSWIMIG